MAMLYARLLAELRAGWRSFAELPHRVREAYHEGGFRGVARWWWQFFVTQSFSSLTRRIVSLNVAGLVALVLGILYLSQFRAGLIDARVEALITQGEIIARAIAWSAMVESDSSITIDPDRLLDLQEIGRAHV